MTMFLSRDALATRKRALRDPSALGGLAGSLQRELHAALDVPVPDGKSRLTRNAGRCVRCTVLLTFDPRSPYSHTCPSCGTIYTDRVHHEWWLMNGHLWSAEQCTRAAAIAYLLDDDLAAQRADDILATYTARYLNWPNRDNALGPTRPFFSTYLESIWLLHLTTALDLRIAANGRALTIHSEAIDRIVAPSAALIAGFDEGRSNRQVWHAAALLAASGVLGNAALRDRAAASLVALLRTGLHTDGSWYEGENYHLFAHRGLLSGVTLAKRAGVDLPIELLQRFDDGFTAPFRTMLPDGTFPARRDSQYGVALRQYRTADWAECGFARRDTPELRAALSSLYATWPSEGETHRWSSSADAERNQPGVRLTRADCSWRALLLARLDLPELTDATPRSELLEGQGLAVFRRNRGTFWVGLDYGDPGDGHGHPDRLNLVIATRDARWLDDVGTGSYTSPTLSWYRSSMAHNAPVVNGQDQGAAHGRLLAHDEQGDAGWVSAEFVDPVSGVQFVRTVVVMSDYVVDELTWTSSRSVAVDVPLQARLSDQGPTRWAPFNPETAQDAMLSSPKSCALKAATQAAVFLQPLPSPSAATRSADRPLFTCALWSDTPATLWRAETIGPPAGLSHGLLSMRQTGTRGRSVRVISGPDAGASTFIGADSLSVGLLSASGRADEHRRLTDGWLVESRTAAGTQTLVLRGLRAATEVRVLAAATAQEAPVSRRLQGPSGCVMPLGEHNYRPTEESWHEAGSPTADIAIHARTEGNLGLSISVSVRLSRPPSFAKATEENPLDNELADVNSDGVQLHWRSAATGDWNSVIAVPDRANVRLTLVSGTLDGVMATWQETLGGYTVCFDLPWAGPAHDLVFDVIVNDCPSGRERRRGQLVLSGARGEFAYLRGARQSDAHALHVVFDPAAPQS